jgi:proteasome lid subunit RPN8/RPN11
VELVLTNTTKDKLDFISNYNESEVSGFLTGDEIVDTDGNITIRIDDLLIPYQEAGHTEVDVDGINGQLRLRQEYGDKCSKIVGHYHSHRDMGAFFSTTDEEMMKQYSANKRFSIFIVSSEGKHLIRLVLKNKPYEMLMENVPYKVEVDDGIKTVLMEEIDKKVKKKEMVTFVSKPRTITDSYEYKSIKKDVDKRIKYYQHDNHTVKIENVFLCYAELIQDEFKNLSPKVDGTDKEHASVIVVLGEKNKAKEFMCDVKAFLIKTLIEETRKELIKDAHNEEEMLNQLTDKDNVDAWAQSLEDETDDEFYERICTSGRCDYNNFKDSIIDDYNEYRHKYLESCCIGDIE